MLKHSLPEESISCRRLRKHRGTSKVGNARILSEGLRDPQIWMGYASPGGFKTASEHSLNRLQSLTFRFSSCDATGRNDDLFALRRMKNATAAIGELLPTRRSFDNDAGVNLDHSFVSSRNVARVKECWESAASWRLESRRAGSLVCDRLRSSAVESSAFPRLAVPAEDAFEHPHYVVAEDAEERLTLFRRGELR